MANPDDLIGAKVRLRHLAEFCAETGITFVGAIHDGKDMRTTHVGKDDARKAVILKLAFDEADLEAACCLEEER